MDRSTCTHQNGFGPGEHDHSACIDAALNKATALCRERGVRLTPQRRRVLELVWQTHRPIGAYDILAELQKEMRAAPPTVYRALDFLQQQGLIHRLASLNAYVGCAVPEKPHNAYFMICRCCKGTLPLASQTLSGNIHHQASGKGFHIEHEIVEIIGLCPACRESCL